MREQATTTGPRTTWIERRSDARQKSLILVCGASGEPGRRVAGRLIERGANVRVLLRAQADAAELQDCGAEIVRGDFRNRESIERAVRGAATVVSGVTALGRMLAGTEGRDGFRAVDCEGNLALVEAAEQAGAARFVFISVGGIERAPQTPYGPAKLAVEARLLRSPLREVIVRPVAFQEVVLSAAAGLDWDNGKLTIFGRGEAPVRYVALDDVAAAVACWTLADDPPRRVEFGGPEGVSRNEVATLIERAVGRPMKRRRVPRLVLAGGSRILKRLKPELATVMGLSLMMDDGAEWDDRPLRELGIEPRPASAYIAQTVGSQEPHNRRSLSVC